ncbi:hypothetical protein [uncultured Methanospirillum sp.]|uniref:hypothetical protein n=1 Tax=uncultured Methanospirillum sp. TaxID=262503 RepID=UPI0029C9AAD6|nr:hypothetical protein [uncultured Methanospirillum sp.]
MRIISEIFYVALILLIIAIGVAPGSASSGYFWSKSGYLNTGQAATYEIQVDCGAKLTLNGPYGSDFDIYAIRSGTGNWPSESYIRSHYDKAELTFNQVKNMNLDQGNWYVVIYAYSGSGTFQLDASSDCYQPEPYNPNPCYGDPNCRATNCPSEATDVKTGYLNSGESKTYVYQIMGNRNYIEWILTGGCLDAIIPMSMMSSNEVRTIRNSYCGPDFSLYIYKDCDPRYDSCTATRVDLSSSSSKYVGITYPITGSKYYAQIITTNGSGAYTLTARSYNCKNDIIAMMAQQPELISMMSTGSDVTAPVSIFNSN